MSVPFWVWIDTTVIVALMTLLGAFIHVLGPRLLKWWDEYRALKREARKGE